MKKTEFVDNVYYALVRSTNNNFGDPIVDIFHSKEEAKDFLLKEYNEALNDLQKNDEASNDFPPLLDNENGCARISSVYGDVICWEITEVKERINKELTKEPSYRTIKVYEDELMDYINISSDQIYSIRDLYYKTEHFFHEADVRLKINEIGSDPETCKYYFGEIVSDEIFNDQDFIDKVIGNLDKKIEKRDPYYEDYFEMVTDAILDEYHRLSKKDVEKGR